MDEETDDTTIGSIDFDDYDIDGILTDIQDEIGEQTPPPTERGFTDQQSVDVDINYIDPDSTESRSPEYVLRLNGHLWNYQFPISEETASALLGKGLNWHDEVGLDLTVEEARELGVDIDDYEEDK